MISLDNSTAEIQRLKNRIEDKIEHRYLDKYIQKPEIDEDKLFILSKVIPKNSSFSNKERDTYITTTMLVQIALDIHELVPAENLPDESKEYQLTKQLRVLAGDYYSGLYYYSLAEVDDLKFIRKLATIIKEINEYKMQLYYDEYDSFQEYIEINFRIESLLINQVAAYMDNTTFTTLINEWLVINRLIFEKQNNSQRKALFTSWFEEQKKDSFLTFDDQLDNDVTDHLIRFENELNKLPRQHTDIKSYFRRKLNNLMDLNPSIVEEG